MDSLTDFDFTPRGSQGAPNPAPVTMTTVRHSAAERGVAMAAIDAVRSSAIRRHEGQMNVAKTKWQEDCQALGNIENMTSTQLRNSLTLVAHVGLEALTLTDFGFEEIPIGTRIAGVMGAVDSFVTGWLSGKTTASVGQSTKETALCHMLNRVTEDVTLIEIVRSPKFQAQLPPFSLRMLQTTLEPTTTLETCLEDEEFTVELIEAFNNYLAATLERGRDPELINRFFLLAYKNMGTLCFVQNILDNDQISRKYHECINTLFAQGDASSYDLIQLKLALCGGVDPCMWNEASLIALADLLASASRPDEHGNMLFRHITEIAPLVEKIPFCRIKFDNVIRIINIAYLLGDMRFVNKCLMESGVMESTRSQSFGVLMRELEQEKNASSPDFPLFPLLGYMLSKNESIDQHPLLSKGVIYYLNNPNVFNALSENQKILVAKAFNPDMQRYATTVAVGKKITQQESQMFDLYIRKGMSVQPDNIGTLFGFSREASKQVRATVLEAALSQHVVTEGLHSEDAFALEELDAPSSSSAFEPAFTPAPLKQPTASTLAALRVEEDYAAFESPTYHQALPQLQQGFTAAAPFKTPVVGLPSSQASGFEPAFTPALPTVSSKPAAAPAAMPQPLVTKPKSLATTAPAPLRRQLPTATVAEGHSQPSLQQSVVDKRRAAAKSLFDDCE